MQTSPCGAAVAGVGAVIPEVVVTNSDLEARMDTTDAWIREKIGIRERRIARADQAMSDLAIPAAREALADAGLAPEELEFIVVAGSNHDMLMPATSCLVQAALGAERAGCLDMKNACSGFVYALGAAAALVQTGTVRNALVVGAEIHSKIIDPDDRTMAPFFGDGAGAVVLKRSRPGTGVLANYYGADGANADAIIVPAGGSREPFSPEAFEKKRHLCTMDGRRVKTFIRAVLTSSVREVLARAGLGLPDLDFLIPHQANLRLIEEAMAELGLPPEKTHTVIEWCGNSGSASIPTVLHEAVRLGKVRPGHVVALVGFGAGLAYGANLLRWAGEDDFLD
ncbi:MAG: ketoacyl-ACP synthase III [Clostridia bacterium]|nr:ketoacyl-ACP synthase III [Clostridia bacterium]